MALWLSSIATFPEDPRISPQHPHARLVFLKATENVRSPERGAVDHCEPSWGCWIVKFQAIQCPLLASKVTAHTWGIYRHEEKNTQTHKINQSKLLMGHDLQIKDHIFWSWNCWLYQFANQNLIIRTLNIPSDRFYDQFLLTLVSIFTKGLAQENHGFLLKKRACE